MSCSFCLRASRPTPIPLPLRCPCPCPAVAAFVSPLRDATNRSLFSRPTTASVGASRPVVSPPPPRARLVPTDPLHETKAVNEEGRKRLRWGALTRVNEAGVGRERERAGQRQPGGRAKERENKKAEREKRGSGKGQRTQRESGEGKAQGARQSSPTSDHILSSRLPTLTAGLDVGPPIDEGRMPTTRARRDEECDARGRCPSTVR